MKQINATLNLSKFKSKMGTAKTQTGAEKVILLRFQNNPGLFEDVEKKALFIKFKAFPFQAKETNSRRKVTHLIKPQIENFSDLTDQQKQEIPVIGDFVEFEQTGPNSANSHNFTGEINLFRLEYTLQRDQDGNMWIILPLKANNLYESTESNAVFLNLICWPTKNSNVNSHIIKQNLPKEAPEQLKNRILGNLSIMNTRSESARLIDVEIELD